MHDTDDNLAAAKQGLLSGDAESSECDDCLDCRRLESQLRKLKISLVLVTTLSTMFIGILLYVWVFIVKPACTLGWSETDFVGVRDEIPFELKKVKFEANLLFNKDQELYRPIVPGRVDYVGTPSAEVDQAWSELVGATTIFVTPGEEQSLGGGLYLEPESDLYMGIPTAIHDLHCLDMIRRNMVIYYDYYNHTHLSTMTPHLEHCLDALRESIMCTGDMTVTPMMWSEERGRILPNFAIDHVCRNYEVLRDWTVQRDAVAPSKYPENAARLHREGA